MVLTTDLLARYHQMFAPIKRGRFLPVVNYNPRWTCEHLGEWFGSIRTVGIIFPAPISTFYV